MELQSDQADPDDIGAILNEMDSIENRIKNKDERNLLEAARRYADFSLALASKNRKLFDDYKVAKRLIALIMKPVMMLKLDCDGLVDYSCNALNQLGCNHLAIELRILHVELTRSTASYKIIFETLETERLKLLIDLAASIERPEDVLYLLMTHEYDLDYASQGSSTTDALLHSFFLYLKNDSDWRVKLQAALYKMKKLPDSRFRTIIYKLTKLASMFPKKRIELYLLYISIDLMVSSKYKNEVMVLLNAAILREECFADVPIDIWSKVCHFLNTNGRHYKQLDVTVESQSKWPIFDIDSVPSIDIIQLCSLMTHHKYLIYDTKLKIFKLNPKLLSVESEDESKITSPNMLIEALNGFEVEELRARKELLHKASTGRKQSIDLRNHVFVIDTNIIIANPKIFDRLSDIEARILIPLIVLEELTALTQHSNSEKAMKAKSALEYLQNKSESTKLSLQTVSSDGSIGSSFKNCVESNRLGTLTNDDLILQICSKLAKKRPSPIVISDDVNMSLKASAMDICCLRLDAFLNTNFIA